MRLILKTAYRQPPTANSLGGDLRTPLGSARFEVLPPPFTRPGRHQRGVALIVTVIMLSVITFLAVAFLALMGREKGSVKTATDQTVAKLASDTALDRAKGELLATILATTNVANFDLLVSTNFVNWNGFDPGAVDFRTNVNYAYQSAAGNPVLTPAQTLQNLVNLFYNPRPPVFITNRLAGGYEFRYYNDLNRNGRSDRTGFWPVTNELGQAVFTNSVPFTNYLVGDPEWLGGLERADQPHSPSNRFDFRYSYLVVPAGKTLDVNYIHNAAQAAQRQRMNLNGTDFFRNQGVGSWEINLAALLHDLNTNAVYGWGNLPGTHSGYDYDSINPLNPILPPIGGNAFNDAAGLLRYRLNGNPTNNPTYSPESISALYGINGTAAFQNDYIDGYSDNGVLFSTNGVGRPSSGLTFDNDRAGRPWVGAPQTNHFFTPQDLFNPAKTDVAGGGYKFTDRLTWAGTNVSTYDQNTFYRLLSQIGTDSAPEDPDRLNLNYVNVGGLSATNFISWHDPDLVAGNARRGIPSFGVTGAVLFFTNAANRLLLNYTEQWLTENPTNYILTFGTNEPFGVANIPVLVSNRFAYTPAVQRVLQLAANIFDASTNRLFGGVAMPSVFRPIFRRDATGVFITGYEEVPQIGLKDPYLARPLDLTEIPLGVALRINVYGVPWLIGAKKGLPNFNEVAMDSTFKITRKIQVTRPQNYARGTPRVGWQTNMMYVIGVSNAVGVEAWNSYHSDYTNAAVLVRLNGDVRITLTNEFGLLHYYTIPLSDSSNFLSSASNVVNWPKGWVSTTSIQPNARSFIIPLMTNIAFLPDAAYRFASKSFISSSNATPEVGQGFPEPQWGLSSQLRLRVVLQQGGPDGPILDYVQLGGLDSIRNVAAEIPEKAGEPLFRPTDAGEFKHLWGTNRLGGGGVFSLTEGMNNQFNISSGQVNANNSAWKSYGAFSPGDKDAAIAGFQNFLTAASLPFGQTSIQVPFTPTRTLTRRYSWQANDPLVHYVVDDLQDLVRSTKLPDAEPRQLKNIGKLNLRYEPWGGRPLNFDADEDPSAVAGNNKFNLALKDSLVRSPDDWEFPTNVYPTVGWLGRVHRGSPWQTIYLKASDVETNLPAADLNQWQAWAGNPNYYDAMRTRPVQDRTLFDLFTTAFDENATRGQLSINQTGLAAWSAVLSGVVALTNTSSSQPVYAPWVIQPAGYYDSLNPNTLPPLVKIVAGINRTRANTNLFPHGTFQHLGDILAVPELSVGTAAFVPSPTDPKKTQGDWYWTNKSPYLELGGPVSGAISPVPSPTAWQQATLTDTAYEWLPQQILSLLRLGDARFVIYAYGQALHPAANSVLTSGPYFQLCTNYQITAEVATRAVVRVEGSPNPAHTNLFLPVAKRYPPHVVVESFNYLAPD